MPAGRAKRCKVLPPPSTLAPNPTVNPHAAPPHVMDMALRVCAQHPSCHSLALLCREFRALQNLTKVCVDVNNWQPTLFRQFLRSHHHQMLELSISDVDLEPMIVILVHSFRHLRKLSLQRCNLRVAGTKEMWVFVVMFALQLNCWEHLQELDLRECEGAGEVLSHMANRFSQAAYWQASRGSMPAFSGFSSLQQLDLSNCVDVTDTTMLHLLSLTSLTSLNLSGCARISAGFMFVAHMSWLRSLDLSCSCEVDGLVLSCLTIGYPAKLWHDHLKPELMHQRAIQGLSSTTLGCPQGLINLQRLSLADCSQVDSTALEHVSRLTALTYLDVSGCKVLDGTAVHYMSAVSSLQHLSLRGCRQIDGPALQPLASRSTLTHLDLGFCSRVEGEALVHLTPCRGLTYLDLQGCQRVDDHALRHLARCTALKHLNISGCCVWSLSGALHQLGACRATLTRLELPNSCHADSAGLGYLARCTALEHLDLPGRLVTGSALLAALFDGSLVNDGHIRGGLQGPVYARPATEEFDPWVHGTAGAAVPVVGPGTGTGAVAETATAAEIGPDTGAVAGVSANTGTGTTSPGSDAAAAGTIAGAGTGAGQGGIGPGAINVRSSTGDPSLGSLSALLDLISGCASAGPLGAASATVSHHPFPAGGDCSSLPAACSSGGLSRLRHLGLRSGCWELDVGHVLQHAGRLTKLQELKLHECHNITLLGFERIALLTQLRVLVLRHCHGVTSKGLSHLTSLTRLAHLDLASCPHVDGAAMSAVAHLTNLSHLNLSNCPQVARRNGLEYVSKLSLLRHLELSDCFVRRSGTVLCHVAALTQLSKLVLENCSLLDAQDLQEFAGLPALRHLNLCGCLKPGPGAADRLYSISSLTTLRFLELGYTRVHVRHVSRLVGLRYLGLYGCLMDLAGDGEELVQYLGGLQKLQSLDLRSNPISSNMLSGISQLVALTQLDLRDCTMLDAETLQHIMALSGCQVFLSGQ